MSEFKAWPKTPRLFRDVVITEKIDGTNAAVIVDEDTGTVWAQSRKRLIYPGKQTDNYGFAGWVEENKNELRDLLGPGHHYGEWWGKGIQHGYGLDEKRFSLFNVARYSSIAAESDGLLWTVPVLYAGPFSEAEIRHCIDDLKCCGSLAAPGGKAEGVIVYHTASSQVYKVLIEHDELPKGKVPYAEKVLAEAQGRSDWREEGAYL